MSDEVNELMVLGGIIFLVAGFSWLYLGISSSSSIIIFTIDGYIWASIISFSNSALFFFVAFPRFRDHLTIGR